MIVPKQRSNLPDEARGLRAPIDKRILLHEGVRTRIKRAYESSVCFVQHRFIGRPNIASAGMSGCSRLFSTVLLQASLLLGVRRVLFSFHTVEIS